LLAGNDCVPKQPRQRTTSAKKPATSSAAESRRRHFADRTLPGIAAWNIGEARFNDPLEDLINDAKTGRGEIHRTTAGGAAAYDFDTPMFAALKAVVEQCSWMLISN
jgi:hypothetical protein